MSHNSLRILHLINSFQLAGAERVAVEVLKGMRQRGHEVYLCAIVPALTPAQKRGMAEIADTGIPVLDLDKVPGKKDPGALLRLVRILRRHEVEIIHTHCNSPDTYGRLAALIAGVSTRVVTLHNVVSWQQNPRLGLLLERFLARHTSRFVAVSDSVRRSTSHKLKVGDERIEVIHNGIEVERFQNVTIERNALLSRLNLDPDVPILLNVGRLCKQKGQKILLSAASCLAEKGFPVQILFAGNGPDRQALEDMATQIDMPIRFLGWQSDMENVYPIADVAVFPSLWEGLPLALLEAMAAGRPIIATDVSAVPEAITDRVNGILIPPADVHALTAAILRTIENPRLRAQLGKCAHERAVAEFSRSVMLQKYQSVYERVGQKQIGSYVEG